MPLTIGAFVALAWHAAPVFAATFTAPLQFSEGTAPEGNYLTAVYDFGVRFKEIDSGRIEFSMPDGYEGGGATTGNSSYNRSLHGIVHGRPNPTEDDLPDVHAFPPFAGLAASKLSVPANVPAEFDFEQREFTLPGGGGTTLFPVWPDFLYSGRGYISLVDVSTSSFHPIGHEGLHRSTTSWLPLAAVESPMLTIVATPVPEPANIVLILLAATAALRWHRRRK